MLREAEADRQFGGSLQLGLASERGHLGRPSGLPGVPRNTISRTIGTSIQNNMWRMPELYAVPLPSEVARSMSALAGARFGVLMSKSVGDCRDLDRQFGCVPSLIQDRCEDNPLEFNYIAGFALRAISGIAHALKLPRLIRLLKSMINLLCLGEGDAF
jgi:hypothetical protein